MYLGYKHIALWKSEILLAYAIIYFLRIIFDELKANMTVMSNRTMQIYEPSLLELSCLWSWLFIINFLLRSIMRFCLIAKLTVLTNMTIFQKLWKCHSYNNAWELFIVFWTITTSCFIHCTFCQIQWLGWYFSLQFWFNHHGGILLKWNAY